jgi:hypothetical protein
MVFDPAVAPRERGAFIMWFNSVVRLQEGHMLPDPAIANPVVRAWYQETSRAFPQSLGPTMAHHQEERWAEFLTEYRFAEHAVFARFQWEVSRHAYRKAVKIARTLQVGFFDISGDEAAVWIPFEGGRYGIIHRGEPLVRKPLPV